MAFPLRNLKPTLKKTVSRGAFVASLVGALLPGFSNAQGNEHFEVSGTKVHRWTGVNSCRDRTGAEWQIALDQWKVAIQRDHPNDRLVGAIYRTPVPTNYRYRHNLGQARRCSGTAYMTLLAEFERNGNLESIG